MKEKREKYVKQLKKTREILNVVDGGDAMRQRKQWPI